MPALHRIVPLAFTSLALLVATAAPGIVPPPAFAVGAPLVASRSAASTWQAFLPHRVRRPTGIAIDLRGKKGSAQWGYVADADMGRIVKFGTGGKVLRSWEYGAPGHPAALGVGGSGNLFVADSIDGTVSKFSPDGKRLALWTPRYLFGNSAAAYLAPTSIAVDPSGKVYLVEHSAHVVYQLTPGGTVLQRWDLWNGLVMSSAVPPQNPGPLGTPTGVVAGAENNLFIGSTCVPTPACSTHFTGDHNPGHDVLSVVSTQGFTAGRASNIWFGLGYSTQGSPVEAPAKESEPFVHIDAMAPAPGGRAVLAGTMWPRAGKPSLAVLSYGIRGDVSIPWTVPTHGPLTGVAVDGRGAVYVSSGTVLLKRSP